MSGIAARRRPRVNSWDYKRLWWVLEREAALRIVFHDIVGTALEPEAREQIVKARRDKLRVTAAIALDQHTGGLWYPPAYDGNGKLFTTEQLMRAEQFHEHSYPPAVGFAHYPPPTPP